MPGWRNRLRHRLHDWLRGWLTRHRQARQQGSSFALLAAAPVAAPASQLPDRLLPEGSGVPAALQPLLENFLELQTVTVEDVMVPRGNMVWLDLSQPWHDIEAQIHRCPHARLPVCQESPDQLLGVLSLRRLLSVRGTLDRPGLMEQVHLPYYIPEGTPILAQFGFFRENRQRIGFVVDEYGDILGLLTLEDIVNRVVGETAVSAVAENRLCWPSAASAGQDVPGGSVLVEGNRLLRDINRQLGLNFPLHGPKTLNGLILEYLQDIPEAGVSLKIAAVPMEIVQTQDRSIRTVRLFRRPPAA